MLQSEAVEMVAAVEPEIERLMAEHNDRREHWYAHDFVPWGEASSFSEKPWDASQATLAPEVRTALVLNLLTEDNLPYYHARLATGFGDDSAMMRWSRQWTAEEGQHAIAIRNYLLATRNCDPRMLEDDRLTTVTRGWTSEFNNPVDIFVYTSAQELATRISHRNAGVVADDETAYKIMQRVAVDENHHFVFYRGVVTAMMKQDPSAVLPHINHVFQRFEMPGTMIPNYLRRAVVIAKAGVYNLRIHADKVVSPLIRDWNIGDLTGLTPEAAQAQEEIMAHPAALIAEAEQFEARINKHAKRRAKVAASS